MKTNLRLLALTAHAGVFICCFLLASIPADAQITPPGYEREMKMRASEPTLSQLDRDSIMVTDTVVIFDPTTYEETTTITNTNYSLRDYCKNFLGMQDPDILLDRKPHTIVDPRNYGDMIIRLNESGKIDTIPPKQ